MKLHPRSHIFGQAQLEFDQFLLDLGQKYDLTYGELFSLFGRSISTHAKYQIRAERHPDDPSKPGDEE